MATTNFREDSLGHDLVTPTSNSLDFLGRPTTATLDFLGRPLRRILRTNTTAVTLGQELQFTGGEKFNRDGRWDHGRFSAGGTGRGCHRG